MLLLEGSGSRDKGSLSAPDSGIWMEMFWFWFWGVSNWVGSFDISGSFGWSLREGGVWGEFNGEREDKQLGCCLARTGERFVGQEPAWFSTERCTEEMLCFFQKKVGDFLHVSCDTTALKYPEQCLAVYCLFPCYFVGLLPPQKPL